ncbi:N-acetyltransferase [Brachybacterium endophyticum]|uniref:N-acetyltransferase n=1 Tax=Brachybacterium endophyticum TaxID=2182385 RepID=A0A2U2RNV8_9MICO|nr:GNAT family N-acetyltransferase [Brachybacterium endophyticum]PWH07549.1 N-acetyltransferase [Brachybacterium endophyticum]
MHLVPLESRHAEAILAGQDDALAREVFGRRWERGALIAFLHRVENWTADGPLREFAAEDAAGGGSTGGLVGGGGLHLVGHGLERGQAELTYWVLPPHRGRGLGTEIARSLVAHAAREPRIAEAVLRIAPENHASQAVARALGARCTEPPERHPADVARTVERWVLSTPLPPGGVVPSGTASGHRAAH